MEKFSSIGRFRNAFQSVHRWANEFRKPLPEYNYIGTVKLHGTNAGVRRSASGKIQPQSRNRILGLDSDNYDFASFVHGREEAFRNLFDTHFNEGDDVTLYGEWVGQGVQNSVAISELERHFVLFNVKINGEYNELFYPLPDTLQDNENGIYNIFQIPHYRFTIDFSNPNTVIDKINELTNEVEDCCPWGKFMGVEGVGEGLVWVPEEVPHISDLWFKTKGGKHSGKGRVKGIKAKIDPEKARNIQECVEIVLPEWRLQQGIEYLKENHFLIEPSSTGEYLCWINKDIQKEELDTITANGLEWKDVVKVIQTRARNYLFDLIDRGV